MIILKDDSWGLWFLGIAHKLMFLRHANIET